ncbi:MAG: 5-bromo-4-chloroindolyl phosphate hydrolysis family protein [Alphaproteobacteria bacterium]|nr:5-bromo-4-chloroindolyl phosphate hydrolysis family protein [Alphaproteobacteria bacterium]
MARSSIRKRPLWIGGWLLFLLPLPLLAKVFIALGSGEFGSFLISAIALGLLLLGAWLTRKGLYQAKRRPMSSTVPFKSIGTGIIAIGTGLTALIAGHNLAIAICFGLAAALGMYLTYGFDRRIKLSSDKDVAEALEEAYQKLERLEAAGENIGSRDFRERLSRIAAWGERILDRIGDDPEDFRRARKFLNVYLDGAQQVTDKFAKTQGDAKSAELEASFRDLLTDMETVCEEQYEHLLNNDMVDLDVQIEVLTTRLKREGVY